MGEDAAAKLIGDLLARERQALLDLSTRNRLLNTPLRTRNNRAIEIVDERSDEVFRLLTDGKALGFLPGVLLGEDERQGLDPDDDVTGGVPQPVDDAHDARGVAGRHADANLQTRLTDKGLQKRLFEVWYDAQTLEQEQGVNILFLALGLLRWYDDDAAAVARHAPLVLLPVRLERTTAADRFRLRWREEPPSPNLTLQAKLRAEFGITIEDFRDEDAVEIGGYFDRVAEAVGRQARWQVLPDAMVLGFFSFAKFLMYRDLDPANWPGATAIARHPLITGLLHDGFPASEPLVPDGASVDRVVRPPDLTHVVDADSSQTVVIAEAAAGRSLVVKGPPGTGKSQTITNIIAAAVARGKSVLFVAEKMAALEVVHRRLEQVGLGPLALELHSNKASKRAVLEELRRTRDAAPERRGGDPAIIERLGARTDALNAFAARLHAPLMPSGLSPRQILARLGRLEDSGEAGVFPLSGAEDWDKPRAEAMRHLVVEVAERAAAIAPVTQHPWRGTRRGPIDPTERAALIARMRRVGGALQTLVAAARVAFEELAAAEPVLLDDLDRALDRLALLPLPAGLDLATLTHPGWGDLDRLSRLVAAGGALRDRSGSMRGIVNEAGLAADLGAIRDAVATQGGSLLRFLSGRYRAAIALLRSYVPGTLPKGQRERLALIDAVAAFQRLRAEWSRDSAAGAAFGTAWQSEASRFEELEAILAWRRAHAALPAAAFAALVHADLAAVEAARGLMARELPAFREALDAVVAALDLDLGRGFGVDALGHLAIEALAARLAAWTADPEALNAFVSFAAKGRELAAAGAEALVLALHDGAIAATAMPSAFDAAYGDVLRRRLNEDWPELLGFDGDSQNRAVADFRGLDRARIDLARDEILAAHAAARPAAGKGGIGPLGVLNHEIAKKRGHLPIRQLLDRAGAVVQQLKPVFMMSPLSVAQYLKPGALSFDILVMDEASQIEPVDALGAVARARQMVVVGDEKQLPPTAFFKKLTAEEVPEDDEDPVAGARDIESVLELALAKGLPYRMLNWHYRSKHQSLIAVSNREFYESRLFIVPSPFDQASGLGLAFHHLPGTAYDRGGTRTNPKEARAVAEAVLRHARETPELSLGVATFSVAQRQAVWRELEILRRERPEAEPFFAANPAEPFFVKNLENIQGDERDVILISVGYGLTAEGYLAHNFGPLSGEGGERRLNVLISRAKRRCEVFANFTGADIDLERSAARGVAALKLFLAFAETGDFGQGTASGADFDSAFEEHVAGRLAARGYDVRHQIGASGFRIDLAVVDPEKPGRFVLGIECDGVQYHSSRSARDRDRLRQQVLEAHGWIIHRLWSADWYLRPETELARIEAAIARAREAWRARDAGAPLPAPTPTATVSPSTGAPGPPPPAAPAEPARGAGTVPRIPPVAPAPVGGAAPYVEARFAVDRRLEPHETSRFDMIEHVVGIVAVEGPIHRDEIVVRIRQLWGLGRAGSRIRAAVEDAIVTAERIGRLSGGPFHTVPGQAVVVRDRSKVGSASLRKPEMLPPQEIDQAMIAVVGLHFGASATELVGEVGRILGFAAVGSQLKTVLAGRVEALLGDGTLVEEGGYLKLSDAATPGERP